MVEKIKYVIMVAGGSGQRMNSVIPKQFIPIAGKPILMHSIASFVRYDSGIKIILVLPECHIDYWKSLCEEYDFRVHHTVVMGGNSRFQSVKNGLVAITASDGLVAVHDGVRPLVSEKTISECYATAMDHGTAVPVVQLVDSVRKVDGSTSHAEDRNKLRLVQTPQVFDLNLIRRAYQQEFSDNFTDDASVVESIGGQISLTLGNRENIKITTTEDLIFAEAMLSADVHK